MVFVWREFIDDKLFYRIYRPFFGDYILERVETYCEAKMRIDGALKEFHKVVIGKPKFLCQ